VKGTQRYGAVFAILKGSLTSLAFPTSGKLREN
jgi:hypothetical protein